MDARIFTDEPLLEIIAFIRGAGPGPVRFVVLDPDRGAGRFAGEIVEVEGRRHRHRPWRVWVDLAERLSLRLRTPRVVGHALVEIQLDPLGPGARWTSKPSDALDPTEKYGRDSDYARIAKAEDPGFVLDLADAVQRAKLPNRARVLDLGVNTGDEIGLIRALCPDHDLSFVGVDHAASAIGLAQTRWPEDRFVCADLGELPSLEIGAFDLVLSIATLHSPAVDDRALLRHIVQSRLQPTGAVIIGVPNCRYVDGEVLPGAQTKNLAEAELSLVVKHVAFYRKYLHQHRKRVFVTGSNYVLVTGVATGAPATLSSR